MTRRQRYRCFISYFSKHQPQPVTELRYTTPFELLVAVILSAQCTDKRVNQVTAKLFQAFPTPEALRASTPEQVFPYIKSISYPNSKAKYLVGMAKMLVEKFGGILPDTLAALQQLPGVGRKTANVVLATVHQKPVVAVDTHAERVAKRLGLVSPHATTPLAVEKTLVANIPSQYRPSAHHWLVLHGRYICLALRPKCHQCPLTDFCWYYARQQRAESSKAP